MILNRVKICYFIKFFCYFIILQNKTYVGYAIGTSDEN